MGTKSMAAGLQLRTEGAGRHATWLELFYDLIYVIVIAKLTHLLAAPYGGLLTLQGYLVFTGLFVPVWWAWTGHTLFANRFDPDDALHRLLTLLQMGAVILMAVFIGGVGAGKETGFALSYAAVRAVLLLMYLRVHLARPDLRFVSTLFLSGFSLGAGLWVVSVFFEPPVMYALWGAGLFIDMATPWAGQKMLSKVSVHSSHLPERLGLLSIIILGEAVLGIVTGSKEVDWSVQSIAAGFSGFVLLCSVWWLYFETLEHALMGKEMKSGQLTIYGHLPIYIGLATMAAGVLHGITGGLPETALLLGGGLLLIVLPMQAIHLAHCERTTFPGQSLKIGLLATGLGINVFMAPVLGPAGVTVAATAVFLVYVLWENGGPCKPGRPEEGS